MADKDKTENLFSSWKEIADYLKCDLRTCRRWEKLGLPVYRLTSTSKARVFAYRDEIDEWIKKRIAEKKSQKTPLASERWRARNIYLAFLAVLIIGLAYLSLSVIFSSGSPADFRIEGNTILILDDKGRELWAVKAAAANLKSEEFYRARFQISSKTPEGMLELPLFIIRDINGDKNPEVLFTIKTEDEQNEGELFCFNQRGKELWRFQAGRELRFGERIFSPDYRIRGFDVNDLDSDGNLEVVVFSVHWPQWPTQLAVLDDQGRPLGEFWNSGHLHSLVFVDLDKDGQKEIIAGGLNNEYGKGCLVVFDSACVRGSSPQLDSEYSCPDLGPGSEKFYILIPRTDVDINTYPVDSVIDLRLLKNNRLLVQTGLSRIFYEFDFGLALPDPPRSSHAFMLMHKEALRKGKVSSTLNGEYWKKLAQEVLYFDGKDWTPAPTMNLRWQDAIK